MERINLLVNKLKEQADAGSDANVMLGTVELIQRELLKQSLEPHKVLGTSKVAVVLPAHYTVSQVETPKKVEPVLQEIAVTTTVVKEDREVLNAAIPVQHEAYMPRPATPAVPPSVLSHNEAESTNGIKVALTPVVDDLTFNDKLKQEQKELQHALQDSAIADLKKAIGINDRFLFINDLFRGDEDMYDRSIRTINNFTAYGEADFWISRELKLKLGWDSENPTVQSFTQLVRRRFS